MLEQVIDRLTVALALARCRARDGDESAVLERWLPAFTPAGRRVGHPRVLALDWSRLAEAELSAPGASWIVQETLDVLPPRYRAAALVDTEEVAIADVAAGLSEPLEAVRRRVHRVRMALRERLTDHFAGGGSGT